MCACYYSIYMQMQPLFLSTCPEGVCPATRTDASFLLIVSWRISCSLCAVRTVHYRYTPFGGTSGSRGYVPPILDSHRVIFHTQIKLPEISSKADLFDQMLPNEMEKPYQNSYVLVRKCYVHSLIRRNMVL